MRGRGFSKSITAEPDSTRLTTRGADMFDGRTSRVKVQFDQPVKYLKIKPF
jgi:hypothetical protein